MNKVQILGVNFDNITRKDTLEKIEEFIGENKFHYIVTPNPEFIVHAQKDEKYKKILNAADLSIPDGTGIIFASKLIGKKLKEKVHGTDVLIDFMPIAAKKGYKIYLLGAKPGVAQIAQKIIENQYPDIHIVGAESGPIFHESDLYENHERITETIERINGSNADFLAIGFGTPKQEKFIDHFKDKLNVKVAIGIGGAIDYISQIVPRAPLWMRRLGLEWLYRLIAQPSRIRRVFTSTIIFPLMVLLKGKRHA